MNATTHEESGDVASPFSRLLSSTKSTLRMVGNGLVLVSRNALALIGLLVMAVLIVGWSKPEWRQNVEVWVLDHLQTRALGSQLALAPDETVETQKISVADASDATAVSRATATDPDDLSAEQANVAKWIARRYKVAPEPIGRLVQEAWTVGQRFKLEPTLILAIMAVESSFNPFAQSTVGAQGLMQVMTNIHDKKYEPFGGVHAAFDPITNLKVGAQVLKECIARGGSLYEGLKHYVGAANLPNDSGYAGKVLAEQANFQRAAAGKALPHTTPIVPLPAPAPAPVNVEAKALPHSVPEPAQTYQPPLDAVPLTEIANADRYTARDAGSRNASPTSH